MRKRRTRSHIIADLSANHVERHALLCGYAVDRVVHDYGIDLILWTYNENGEVESGQVFLQLKATDDLPLLADGQTIAFSVQHADLELWLTETMPYILVVYDARTEVAYWLYIQAYFERLADFDLSQIGETFTVHLSTENRLSEATIREFRRFKQRVRQQAEGVIHHGE
jgi:hypothetical protein